MKFFKSLLALICISVVLTGRVEALNEAGEQDSHESARDINDRDWQILRDFLKTKQKDIKEKADNLAISGDVRLEWRHLDEHLFHHRLRGGNATDLDQVIQFDNNAPQGLQHFPGGIPISRNDFDIEANLWFKYTVDRTWAVLQLQFDNPGGVSDNDFDCTEDPRGYHGSGRCNDLCLKRAFWGWEFYTCGPTNLTIEVGRRKLYDVFESELEFNSRFDGILFQYSTKWNSPGGRELADFKWKIAGFLIDERVNHFGWVTEFDYLDILNTGLEFKYSFIYWNKNGKNRCFVHNPLGFQFKVSQWLFTYNFKPKSWDIPAQIFGAFLYNHAQLGKKGRCGAYLGFLVGEVVKEGDWSFEIQIQALGARVIPDGDNNGMGIGNVLGDSFTRSKRANVNYKGIRFESLYALTDHLTIDTQLEWSRALSPDIGGSHSYSKFEIEAIYAF